MKRLQQPEVDLLREQWTDRYVQAAPGRPELRRFAGMVGRVVTVNFNGAALVDFADGAWYDIPADADHLIVIDAAEAAGKYDASANSSQPSPARQA